MPCGMRDLPGPGIHPVSPALAGEFLTSGLPGNTQNHFLMKEGYWSRGERSAGQAPSVYLGGTQSLAGEQRVSGQGAVGKRKAALCPICSRPS